MKNNARKSLSFLLIGMVTMAAAVIGSLNPAPAQAEDEVDIDADSAILVDEDTGKILYAKDADEALPPASMTKMMTEYLVWEAIESDEITWDDTPEISDYAYSISANDDFSGVGLRQDKEYTVEELYEAMAIYSDNAATIALAEHIDDSEGDFVDRMNDKAEEMELPDSKFVNSSGLANESLGDDYPEGTEADDNNLMSSRTAALLAHHLVSDYPEALDISSVPEEDFDVGDGVEESMENWNWMLDHDGSSLEQYYYEGVDGLKTGHTDAAGYTFTGTAEQDDTRLISVVMKSEDEGTRFEETAELLEYGFSNFDTEEIFAEGDQAENDKTIPVAKGKDEEVEISINDSFSAPIQKDDEENFHLEYSFDEDKLTEDGELNAPVEKGDKVGTAEIVYDGDDDEGYLFDKEDEPEEQSVDVIANDSVDKKNWFMLMLSSIGGFFSSIFHTVVDWITGLF